MKVELEYSNVQRRVGSRGPKAFSDQEYIQRSENKINKLTLEIDKAVKDNEPLEKIKRMRGKRTSIQMRMKDKMNLIQVQNAIRNQDEIIDKIRDIICK